MPEEFYAWKASIPDASMVSRLEAAVAETDLVYQEREANEANDDLSSRIGESVSVIGAPSKPASEVGGMEVDTGEIQQVILQEVGEHFKEGHTFKKEDIAKQMAAMLKTLVS